MSRVASLRGNGTLDHGRKRADQAWVQVERGDARELDAQLARDAARLDIQIVEGLDVVGEEAHRSPGDAALALPRQRGERFSHPGPEPIAAVGPLALVAKLSGPPEPGGDRSRRGLDQLRVRIP